MRITQVQTSLARPTCHSFQLPQGSRIKPPNSQWRILVSSIDKGPSHLARNFGHVVSNFKFFVKSSYVNVTEKLSSWANSMRTCAEDFT